MVTKNIKSLLKDHFLMYPTAKLRVREIERALSLPLPSVIRYCAELEKEGLLMKVRVGSVVFFSADRSSGEYLLEKRLFNLKQVYHAGLVSHLKEILGNPVIILFGSYARGEDIESSDIDLFIATRSKKTLDVAAYEKLLGRAIQVLRSESIGKISNKHLANNIINGVTLSGYLEVFR